MPLIPPPPPRTSHLSVVSSERLPVDFNALLLAASQGERAAFCALFEHFAPRLKTWLMHSGSSENQAEDIAQEAMLKVWRKAAQFNPTQAGASTWIFTIARNLRTDLLRRQGQPTLDIEALPDLPEPGGDALDETIHARRCDQRVRLALAQLTAEQALVVRLSYFEEQPHAQIAAALGIPLGTVKSRLRLALNHLRRLLDGLSP